MHIFDTWIDFRATEGILKTFPQPEELAEPLLKGWSEEIVSSYIVSNVRSTHTCRYTPSAAVSLFLLQSTLVTVEGDHHVHLNNPERVAPIIADFLLSQTSEHNTNASIVTQAPKL